MNKKFDYGGQVRATRSCFPSEADELDSDHIAVTAQEKLMREIEEREERLETTVNV